VGQKLTEARAQQVVSDNRAGARGGNDERAMITLRVNHAIRYYSNNGDQSVQVRRHRGREGDNRDDFGEDQAMGGYGG